LYTHTHIHAYNHAHSYTLQAATAVDGHAALGSPPALLRTVPRHHPQQEIGVGDGLHDHDPSHGLQVRALVCTHTCFMCMHRVRDVFRSNGLDRRIKTALGC